MKTPLAGLCVLALSVAIVGQESNGTIAGKVTDQTGATVTGVTVEARHGATGAIYKGAVSSEGDYSLAQLPAGTYELSIPIPRGAFAEILYQPFVQKDVVVPAGQTVSQNIVMRLQMNLATLGDAPPALLAGMRARTTLPTGPAPRMTDGKPDFSGFWLNENGFELPTPVPFQPWAEEIRKKRQDSGTPSTLSFCLPSTPIPIAQPFPYQLVQNHSMLVMLQDLDFPGWRQIFLDGRPHPKQWNPAWFGHAVGTWDGDTLVVDVVGFNDQSFIGGGPHTEQLHVVERIRRPDAGHLEIDITAEDPGAFTGPWKRRVTATLASKDEQILEYLCENNVFPQHLVK